MIFSPLITKSYDSVKYRPNIPLTLVKLQYFLQIQTFVAILFKYHIPISVVSR